MRREKKQRLTRGGRKSEEIKKEWEEGLKEGGKREDVYHCGPCAALSLA